MEVVRCIHVQVLCVDLQQIRTALVDVVRQQLDAVDAHQREQRVMPPLKVGPSKLGLDRGQLSPQDLDEKVAASGCGFKKARINAFRLVFDKIEH